MQEYCLKHLTTDLYQNVDVRSFEHKFWRLKSGWISDMWGYALGFMASTFDMNVRCPHFELWSRIWSPNCDEQESTMCLPMEMAPCIVDGKEMTWSWHVEGIIQIGGKFQARRIGVREKEGRVTIMRIVTYNINGLRPRLVPPRTLLSFLDSLDSDIICFQVLTSLHLP